MPVLDVASNRDSSTQEQRDVRPVGLLKVQFFFMQREDTEDSLFFE